jgi:hypothetical protein
LRGRLLSDWRRSDRLLRGRLDRHRLLLRGRLDRHRLLRCRW